MNRRVVSSSMLLLAVAAIVTLYATAPCRAVWLQAALPAAPTTVSSEAREIRLDPVTGPPVTFKGCYREISATAKRPAKVTRSPKGATSWLVFPWSGGEAIVALGQSHLWVDRDHDGDFAEEPPTNRSEPIHLPVTLGSRTIDAQVRLEGDQEVRIINETRLEGLTDLDNRSIRFAITDYLANGSYDDVRTTTTPEYWLSDHAHFDLDGDGRFKDRIPPSGEDFSLARAFVIGGKPWSFEVLNRGDRARIARRSDPMVTLTLNVDNGHLSFVSDDFGDYRVRIEPIGTNVGHLRIPKGSWRMGDYDYVFGGHDVSGLWWWKEDGSCEMAFEKNVQVTLRGFLLYDIGYEWTDNGRLLFWTSCHGPRNERVEITPEGRSGNNYQPHLEILDGAGTVLYEVTSHYC